MKNSRVLVAVVAASLFLASGPARAGVVATPVSFGMPGWFKVLGVGVFFCAAGLISSAWAKSLQMNQQLTPQEAASCGFSYFYKPKP